jgi:hypothetical protein
MYRIALISVLASSMLTAVDATQPRPGSPAAATASTSPLVDAIRDEIARAMAGLRVPDQPAPYFIACTVTDMTVTSVSATLGSVVNNNMTPRSRQVRVEVRVGDYARDNSRFFNVEFDPGIASSYASGVIQGSLDDNPDVLRRQLWLITDAAYRRAISTFAKKQAALQNQVESESIPDFSRETPQQRIEPMPPASTMAPPALVAMARTVSAALNAPEIASSEVALYAVRGTRTFVNSEGFATITPIEAAGVRVGAELQAADGMPLRDLFTELARTPELLPATPALVARARELAAGLVALRSAPRGEDYTGPVLVEQQAASELLAQTLVPLFLSLRAPEAANPQMAAAMARAPSSPYLTRVGSKVLPEAVSIRDTPSLRQHEGRETPGAYLVDEEGVSAQDVTLCDKGVLKSLLTTRTPQRGFLQSNGHSRGGFAQASVFQVEWAGGVPATELRARYLARLKQEGRPFGYILRAIGPYGAPAPDPEMMMRGMGAPPSGPSNAPIIRAFKVTPDGQETLVRGLQLGDVAHTAWRDLADASAERTVYSYRGTLPPPMRRLVLMPPGIVAGDATVTIIAPNLLFGELEIQKTNAAFQRPPIVASPLP